MVIQQREVNPHLKEMINKKEKSKTSFMGFDGCGCGCAMIFMGLMAVVAVCWWLNEILFYCSVYIILLC